MTMRKLLRQPLTMAAMLLLGGLLSSPAQAQFIGYTSPQTVQSSLATNVACTGLVQNYTVPNLGQTQHYAFISYSAQPQNALAVIQGLDVSGNATVISDAMQGQPSTTGSSAILVGLGYFPVVRIQIICSTVGAPTFSLTYMGASATAYSPLGSQVATQLDKVLLTNAPANANGASQPATPPFGNSSGELVFQYAASGPTGSTLQVVCGGSSPSTNIGTGHIQTFSFTPGTANTQQIFIVPPSPCPFYEVQYTSGGASATTYNLEYFFNAPGNITNTTLTVADPCLATSTQKLSAPINITTATTTQIVGLVTGQKIYPCSIVIDANVNSSSVESFQWVYGTGSSCGTGTTALSGAMLSGASTGTGPIALAVAGGTLFGIPVSNALCLTTVQVSGLNLNVQGHVSYVQQ